MAWQRRGFAAMVVAFLAIGIAGTGTLFGAPKAKGSVSGRILTTDGKPAAGMAIRLEQDQPMGAAPPGGMSAGPGSDATGLQAGKPKVIARVTTDKEGKFTFNNIDEGTYIIVGGSNSVGWIYFPVTVEPNKDSNVGDIPLAKTD